MYTAYSGMNTALLRLSSAAHNIANLNTPEFHRQQVVQREQAEGGVTATVIREAQVDASGSSAVNDLVQQLRAGYSFKANLQTIKTADTMLGALFDSKI